MKKPILLMLIALASTLTGCNQGEEEEPVDPTKVVKIQIMGDMEKNYAYNDTWDLSGIYVDAIQANNERKTLKSSEYKLNLSAAAPKNMAASFTITARYQKDKAIAATRVFNDIYVADEVYDEQAEKDAYYADCNLGYTGTNLLNELHRHSFAKHTTFIAYKDIAPYITKSNGVYDSIDLIPGKHKTEYFYTGKETGYQVGTREHVWPCADSAGLWPHSSSGVDNPNYTGGGSDLYHVRPSDTKVNNARGDAPFVDFGDSEFRNKKPTPAVGDGGPYTLLVYGADRDEDDYKFAELVEPADEFKGDIARIIAYIYMHYKTNSNTPTQYKSYTGSLALTSVLGYSSSRCIEIIKKWNNLDKPSDVEKHRNHVVQQIQGNRNPFVDDYTLLDKMFN